MLHQKSFWRAGPTRLTGLALLLLALLAPASASSEIYPSSDVLVPYFEVDLANPDLGLTTLFSVASSSHKATDARLSVHTNWGIPVLDLTLTLRGGEVRSVNLRDWLAYGNLPDRQLSGAELAHLQAALSGQPSPRDDRYYSTEVEPGLAVGYITIRTLGTDPPDVLWGDLYTIGPERNSFQAETLVNLDRSTESRPDCKRHAVRFLNAGPLENGTQIVVWTGRRLALAPSPTPEPIGLRAGASLKVLDEAGRHIENRLLEALPVQVVEVGDLGLQPAYGWLDIRTRESAYIAEHLHAATGASAELHAYCLPEETLFEGSRITIRLLANGQDTDSPGPIIPWGGTIDWEYLVTNAGVLPLSGIVVSDDSGLEVRCPKDALDPGESMTCMAQSTASMCQNTSGASVTALAPDSSQVSDHANAEYYGQHHAAIRVVTMVNGNDANEPPGPRLSMWDHPQIGVIVTNTGDVPLREVVAHAPVWFLLCENHNELQPNESFTCFSWNRWLPIGLGQQRLDGSATGTPPCGPEVNASDPAYYYGLNPWPSVYIEKWANGQRASQPPGPVVQVGAPILWEYHITNTGEIGLILGVITDEDGMVVTCPKTDLAPQESTVCYGSGIAEAGQNSSVTAVHVPPTFIFYGTGYYLGWP